MKNKIDWKKFIALGEKKQKGHEDKMLAAYLPIIKHYARKLRVQRSCTMDLDDLVSCGAIGFLQVIRSFDYAKPFAFSSFAKKRIIGAMKDALRQDATIPRSLQDKAKKMEQDRQKLAAVKGSEVDNEELTRTLNITLDEFHEVTAKMELLARLGRNGDREVSKAEDFSMIFDLSNLALGSEVDEQLCDEDKKSKLLETVMELPERHAEVTYLYYYEEKTFKQIADLIGLSKSRVVQMHKEVIKMLGNNMHFIEASKSLEEKAA